MPSSALLWCLFALPLAAGCGGATGRGALGTPSTAAGGPLEIVVSGDTAGWIVPCGCTANQSGGLLRRGTYVRQAKARHATVLLDAGGSPGGASPYERARFEAILTGLGADLAAHNLGGPELQLGPAYLRQLAEKPPVPFVSANATDLAGMPLAPSHVLIEVAGRKLLVVGVVAPRFATAEVKVGDPKEAVLTVRSSLRGKFDTLVVLAYLPEEELRALAAALPEADLVIGGPTGQALAPTRVGPAQLAAATNKGKFLVSFESPTPGSTWQGKIVELTKEFADDARQQGNLVAFRRTLADRDFTAEESGLATARLTGLPADYRAVGSAACRNCHVREFVTWEASAHVHAWQTLAKSQSDFDSACQQCHTTGFGWPGGFVSARRSADRVNVGCESCHGPSQAHAADPMQKTPLAAREQCLVCHDRENSPEFEFGAYWKQIAHGPAAR